MWHPDKLKSQLNLFEQDPDLGMVYGLHKLIDENGGIIGEVAWRKRGNLFRYLLGGNKISGSGSMVMIKREVFEKVGVFHEDFLIGEDWEMWLRIARDYKIDYVDDFIADLRVLGSGMQQNHLKMARGLEYMLPVMLGEFELSYLDRSRLIGACLRPACANYLDAGDRTSARKAFLKLLRHPLALPSAKCNVWFAYIRLTLGNSWLRSARSKLSHRKKKNNA